MERCVHGEARLDQTLSQVATKAAQHCQLSLLDQCLDCEKAKAEKKKKQDRQSESSRESTASAWWVIVLVCSVINWAVAAGGAFCWKLCCNRRGGQSIAEEETELSFDQKQHLAKRQLASLRLRHGTL